MQALTARDINHAVAHEEAVEEDGRRGERDLGEFEHDADLEDEIDALAPVVPLLVRGQAIESGGSAKEFWFGEKPLRLRQEEELVWQSGRLSRR